ncbi:MAG: acetyltransferase [Lachnospiraceae bacterium]|nr:acetyltransferase [Lachnospiraceae bacterium]
MKNNNIKKLRAITGQTQKAFAENYGIPLSTLRKWEQNESAPPEYVEKLIARTLPSADNNLMEIDCSRGIVYYYDPNMGTLSDGKGNSIRVSEEILKVKKQNLSIYVEDLFSDYYSIVERFERDCRYDQTDSIIWTRLPK